MVLLLSKFRTKKTDVVAAPSLAATTSVCQAV